MHVPESGGTSNVVFCEAPCEKEMRLWVALVVTTCMDYCTRPRYFEKTGADAIGGWRQGGGGGIWYSSRCGYSSLGEKSTGVIIFLT